MSTGSTSAPLATVAPTTRHSWHKLLIALVLLGRVTRVPAAMDATTGSTPSGWWLVVWEVLALVLAAFAVSEWEILAASSWRMSVSQWIWLVLFHVGLLGFLGSLLFQWLR
ncbi:hypothetical protein QA943_37830 [Streptomyces sp. B21-097]|uniref:hypothetical protein n=1 Tax=Streptomyces sp. B21-097 TaxID=3039414 RepID=UPI002FF02484